jgi:hypothetical protein
MIEMQAARDLIADVEEKLHYATDKKTAAKRHLFRAQVFTRIYHIILNLSLPLSSDLSLTPCYPTIVTSEGPPDAWGQATWTDPPSCPLHSPLAELGPCYHCRDLYHTYEGCPLCF